MKKAVCLVVVLALMFSMMSFSVAVSAEEGAAPIEKVHFDWGFEDYAETDVRLPKSSSGTYGSFTQPTVGKVKKDWDGNAFYTGENIETLFYYTPSEGITDGKLLLSVDLKYNANSAIPQKSWSMISTPEDGVTDYLYLLSFENPQDTYGAAIYTGNGKTWRKDKLLTAKPGQIYSIDILVDLDGKTQKYYVNGVLSKEYPLDYTFNITKFNFRINSNIECLDNFKLVENPDKYTFDVEGEVTTQDKFITVKFSDTVNVTCEDFVIDNGEVAVTAIEQISGKMLRLQLSECLAAGLHNLSLADVEFKSVSGTKAENISAEFEVIKSVEFFDMGFEDPENFKIKAYFDSFNDYGTWSFVGSAALKPDNAYRFAGDETNGVMITGPTGTASNTIKYELNEVVTDGRLTISFDAAFNSAYPERQYLLCVNDYTNNNAKLMTFGKLYSADNIDTTVISGCKADMHFSGGDLIGFEDNVAHRWDTVVDLDNKTVTNYCDGVAFNSKKITVNTLDEGISAVYLRVMPGIVFFDNFRMTYNVNAFEFKAENIYSETKSVFIEFEDTIAEDAEFVFTDPEGNTVIPESVVKVTPKRYKAEFAELVNGTYKVSLSKGVASIFGATTENNETEFKVVMNPEFKATNLVLEESAGKVVLKANITNTTKKQKRIMLLIGIYSSSGMEECAVGYANIASGTEEMLKAVALETDKDLSEYTVRGFVWNGEDLSPLSASVIK